MITAVARGDGAEDLGDRAQGVRRGPLRDVRPGVRARRVPRAADRADRGDGPRAGGQRRVLQQDPAIDDPDERAAFVAERRREYDEDVDLVHLAASSSSTRSCSPRTCATNWCGGLPHTGRGAVRMSPGTMPSLPSERVGHKE